MLSYINILQSISYVYRCVFGPRELKYGGRTSTGATGYGDWPPALLLILEAGMLCAAAGLGEREERRTHRLLVHDEVWLDAAFERLELVQEGGHCLGGSQ